MSDAATLFVVALAGVILLGVMLLFAKRMLSQGRPPHSRLGPSEIQFRYKPLLRLLSEDDFAFLRSQPGFRPGIAKRLRSRRVAAFRGYLVHLEAEFLVLHLALRLMNLYAPQDRPDLARELIKQRLVFSFRMAEVRFRLAFLGLGMRPVSVQSLVESVEQMRAVLTQVSPQLAAAHPVAG
jgi:hypothetical protein